MGFSPASVPEGFQRASGKPFGAPVGAYPFPRRGLTRRLRRGRWVCRPPRGEALSFEAKERTKESTRHGDSRGGPPRCALFANIGVPGTAVPGSCICSGLPVANCLRQLCPLGTRSLSAQASACGSPSGCPLPRFASLTRREKGFYCPFWRRGSLCRAQHGWPAYACYRARSELAFFRRQNGRAFFPPLPIAALLPRSWRGAGLPLAGWDASM